MSGPPARAARAQTTWRGGYMNDFYAREFWRFVAVQREVGKLAQTAIDFPPMQCLASFNLSVIKARIDELLRQHEGE